MKELKVPLELVIRRKKFDHIMEEFSNIWELKPGKKERISKHTEQLHETNDININNALFIFNFFFPS